MVSRMEKWLGEMLVHWMEDLKVYMMGYLLGCWKDRGSEYLLVYLMEILLGIVLGIVMVILLD